jgi:hypothetical protein
MKTLIPFIVLMLATAVHAAVQPLGGSTELMKANGGRGTNTLLVGTNTFRGDDNQWHGQNFNNDQFGGNTWFDWSFGDGSLGASNRWRVGVSLVGWSIYDVRTDRYPLSIATADGSSGGDGNVNINGVTFDTNGTVTAPVFAGSGSGGGEIELNGASSGQTILTQTSNGKSNTVAFGLGSPTDGQVLKYSSACDCWTNVVDGGGSGATDVETNIVISSTANVLIDFAAANQFRIFLLTNATLTFTNPTLITNYANHHATIWYQQDTNGQRTVALPTVVGGLLQTNTSMQPTTNANGLDVLEIVPGFFRTNLIAWWPQNFQPRVAFTNSLVSGGGGGGEVASDNFDAYDDADHFVALDTTANWVNVSADQIWVTNPSGDGEVYPAIFASDRLIRHTATLNANHYSTATLTAVGGGYIGVAVRCQNGADSGYYLLAGNSGDNTLYLVRRNAGTSSTIVSTSKTYSPGVKLKLEVSGSGSSTRLTASEDTGSGWVAVWTSQDPGGTYIDNGFAGLAGNGAESSTRMDDWSCGDL